MLGWQFLITYKYASASTRQHFCFMLRIRLFDELVHLLWTLNFENKMETKLEPSYSVKAISLQYMWDELSFRLGISLS